MHLAIRADGGPDIGYGHLTRSGALAREFLSRGHAVTFATVTPEHAQEVCPTGIETLPLQDRGDPDSFVSWLESARPDVVFTDAYPVDTSYQREVRERTILAVHQDDDRHRICADLFVNGNLYAPNLEYAFQEPTPRTYLGTDYVLLRSELREQANETPPRRIEPQRALVTMGGSDVAKVTPAVIRAFDGYELHVDVIVGPGFESDHEYQIRAASADVSADVAVLRNPDNLVQLMFDADFAVCTPSVTAYELMALGTPMVCRQVRDNQAQIARGLRSRDVATVVNSTDGTKGIRKAIGQYVSNHEIRLQRQRQGRDLVDCRGAIRLADVMIERAQV